MNTLHNMTDEELAISYTKGSNAAFDLLLSRNQQRVFNYILFIVHNRDIADDLFQETFIKVIIKLQEGKYVSNGKFTAWLMRVAHNVVIDWFRSQKAEKIVNSCQDNDLQRISDCSCAMNDMENQLITSQSLSDLRRLMEQLPVPQREVVYMRFFQNLSFKEIAEESGVSINTSLGRMRYALLNLRRMMDKYNLEFPIR